MRTKAGEKEKLRAAILEKTLIYLKENGRAGAGTQPMMEKLGLTRGALYSHFKSKDDLFVQAICSDLENLENALKLRFQEQGHLALKRIIDDHLSEQSLNDVGTSCVFTSLASDMQRLNASQRRIFEAHLERLFSIFAQGLREKFPDHSPSQLDAKARNLYSGLVGVLTMARTVQDPKRASQILRDGRKFLTEHFAPNSG